ncbi:MAG: hypothetical protein A2015_16670 [Spirochaetes bacterium GWF1_31_7]|nr:MAG: hypothetical protein A2Y30_14035 [Spirochaetes bacterium GWE1_32_154]OHD50076.1 MAG: hypothetical protein A2Y29_12080 [Spirochaetes bacterium GWE2_31_10]OHD52389.1 MAG: hypothetical protein A2015_16670 [Spirochaetes bacterium GWF1_31_7]HBD96033.1 hypothetical protein [Spirochaetia bacterium]HBI38545.1 hypothetical protein [Spirochaetia bacterium]
MVIQRRHFVFIAFVLSIFTVFYYVSLKNYLLFHVVAEFYSVSIALTLFLISWNTRAYHSNKSLLFLGIAYFFIGILDLLHTISFKGMNIFQYQYYANQVWIASRFMESISLLVFIFVAKSKKNISYNVIILMYAVITAFIVWSIYFSTIFPVCFIEGQGQTTFKMVAEFIIILILVLTLLSSNLLKNSLTPYLYKLFLWSILITIISESFFTLYISNYDISNFMGHIFKIISFYLIYKAIIETSFKSPFTTIFRELKKNEIELIALNKTKDKFLSLISHDLRSPMGSVKGLTEILIQNENVMQSEKRVEILNLMVESTGSSINLLNNMLFWAKSQSGNTGVFYSEINIHDLVENEIQLMRSTTKIKKIEIENHVNKDLMIDSDRNLVSTIIRNIMSNAVKFSYPDTNVVIDAIENDNSIVISIKDFGVGISKDVFEKLFIDDTSKIRLGTKKENGSGLGLFVTNDFIQLLQGTIHAVSKPGETVFSITLKKK